MTREELDRIAGPEKKISNRLLQRKLKLTYEGACKKLDECELATYEWPELGIEIIR